LSGPGGEHTLGRRLRKALEGEIESVVEHSADAPSHPGRAIHEIRKSIKRARALLRLARPGIGEDRFREENVRYRKIGKLLGPVRDADVDWSTFKRIRSEFPQLVDDDSVQELRHWLKKRRKQARKEALASGGPVEQVRRRSRAAREAIADLGLDRVGPGEVAAGLARIYRDGALRWEAARERRDPGIFHGWRRRVKDLYYQLKFLAPGLPDHLVERIPAQDDLGEELGLANDWTILVRLLETRSELIPDGECRARIVTAILEERNAAWAEAVGHGEDLYAEDPSVVEAEVRAALGR
jgi:CHAD domain-containing protein